MSGSTTRTTTEFAAAGTSFLGIPPIVRELANRLHAAGIIYCHWKGNARLKEAVVGLRDLDILVDRDGALELSEILATVGFKRFESSPWVAFPALEDYLALDPDTGRLVHLHLHYRLTMGESFLNGYRLPWESLVLSTRYFDTAMTMYVADPHMELLLLIARAVIRLGPIDRIAGWLGRPCFDAQTRSDLRWLAARTNPHRLAELAEGLVGKEASRLLLDIVSGEPSYRLLRALKRQSTPPLSEYRTYAPAGAVVRRGMRFLFGLAVWLNRKFLRSLVIPGRTLPNGGLMIAFGGDDKSSRATLVYRIAEWLTWKLDVVVLDAGGGARLGSVLQRVPPWRPGRLRGFAAALTALVRARDSRARCRKAFRARSRGMVVLYDGFSEGQSLGRWLHSSSRVLRAIARWEGAPYRAWDADPPDLFFRLRRAPRLRPEGQTDIKPGEVRSQSEDPQTPGGRPTLDTVEIDPNHPPDQVLLIVQRALWQKV